MRHYINYSLNKHSRKIRVKPLDHYWYQRGIVPSLLLPLSLIYCTVVNIRRFLYRLTILKHHRLPVPVIIVGNINIGGTGKTPVVVYLCALFTRNGYHPGIISRGYKGRAKGWPQSVTNTSDPYLVGDESVLLANKTNCPVVVGPNRVAAALRLLETTKCDLIISDDGLQHYALDRDTEIVVVDAQRQFGNGYCLPAGPLREPIKRIKTVDFVVSNGDSQTAEYIMHLLMSSVVNLYNQELTSSLQDFKKTKIHAVAGIGNPERFFNQLTRAGLVIIRHPFADHHNFTEPDVSFEDDLPVLMTEKDAVKCRKFATHKHWFVPVEATISEIFDKKLLKRIHRNKA